MPQFRRSVAFSNKKKKEQLKAKKQRKQLGNSAEYETNRTKLNEDKNIPSSSTQVRKILQNSNRSSNSLVKSLSQGYVPSSNASVQNYYLDSSEEIIGGGASSKHNRYNLKFRKGQTDTKRYQNESIVHLSPRELEVSSSKFYPEGLDFPKRPSWKKSMSKAELEQSENRYFRLFCESIDKSFAKEDLSLYELNLETWRQLWRVMEMSDILLLIVDARFAVAQFPPYLYHHLIERENKGVILILNKCDLIEASLVIAWQDYFTSEFPKLIVVPFSSMEGKIFKKSNFKLALQSSLKLIEACQALIDGNVDLTSWRQKVTSEMSDGTLTKCKIFSRHDAESLEPELYDRYKNGTLTLGTIGHPNVGKSSMINALMGKKVVSVSKTPGHTKHFQTIFITKNVKLCDCPGLVFPSLCQKELQVILGSYPIAQVRNPLESIYYAACRMDMASILKLKADEQDLEGVNSWTPYSLCEAWAKKRGYFVRSRGGCPDVYRAANELLRFTLTGFKKLVVALRPPGYSENIEKHESDPRVPDIKLLQSFNDSVSEDLEPEEEVQDSAESDNSPTSADEASATETEEDSDSNYHDAIDIDGETSERNDVNKFELLSMEDC